MNTPLIDLIVATEAEKVLDSFITSFFSYDLTLNMWVFPGAASAYGVTAEAMDQMKKAVLDLL